MTDLNNGLDFEQHIKGLQDRELMEWTARQVYTINNRCVKHFGEMTVSRKKTMAYGGVAGTITAVVIGVVEWFIARSRIGTP